MDKIKKSKKPIIPILALSIIAVIFIPMLYSSIYLGAFWDPYGNISKVPVAFVNLDKDIYKDGKKYAIGKNLVKKLEKNKIVDWKFVSLEKAKKGLKGKDYYAMVEIPADFSRKIANSKENSFKTPTLFYKVNKGKNLVFSQISERVASALKVEISSGIQKEIAKSLGDNLQGVKISLKDASKATTKLKDGTSKLLDGSQKLSSGIANAAVGSNQLQNGLAELTKGQEKVVAGSDAVINGLNSLKSSLTKPNPQVSQLAAGAAELANNASKVSSGTESLQAALNDLTKGAENLKLVAQNIDKVYEIINAQKLIIDNSTTMSATEKEKLQELTNNALTIVSGIKMANLNDTATKTTGQLSGFQTNISYIKQVATGATNLSNGVNTLISGMFSSQKQAAQGVDQLINGSKSIKSGSKQILEGLSTASIKTGTLTEGLNTINKGSMDLNNGLNSANDGIIKLSDGLNSGYKKLDKNLKFKSNDMAKYVANPVNMKKNTINNVKKYGEGLAPYFISLSLWLGAMFISLIFSLAAKFKLVNNKFLSSFMGKYLIGSILVTIQAGILSFVLIETLNIEVTNIFNFYLTNMFISVVFFSVMYGVSHGIGILSTPIMFIIFLLQLSSAGGTFPIETAPTFYQIVSKVFPMTYSVSTLRMVISGVNMDILRHNFFILSLFMLCCLFGGLIVRTIIDLSKINKVPLKIKKFVTSRD